ncbi:MAG: glutamate 2,3-aminomutase [Candidatus Desulforudis sp.]|nr:glutamate 2,3-aminomutase [Desulforudis sp.]
MATNRIDSDFLTAEEERRQSLRRAEDLRRHIDDYLAARDSISCGREWADQIERHKERLLNLLGGTEDHWRDWHWQMRNRISDVGLLSAFIELERETIRDVERVSRSYRWAVSPYYAAVAAAGGIGGPVWRQAVPAACELADTKGTADPMAERLTSPAPGITRRYPDRLIINVTNQCPMYCRHCQRRRNIGELDRHQPKEVLEAALDYIRANPEIRDVLITGGDALLLSDNLLDWLLDQLHRIEHVEIKRLGTRTLATLPQRITLELCAVLEKYPPIYINTQFNHPLEVTPEAAAACDRLVRAGVVLGNQAVLLKGVNNDPHVMKKLNHELLRVKVRPYYIFHAKSVRGTSHFITPVEEGLEIMEKLRGYTSGLAVPTYIINAPGGYGKTPILPPYVLEHNKKKLVLRTWENRIIPYPNDPSGH